MRIREKDWWLLGPLFIIIGAALWGTETFFRVNLNTRFDSEVLVFYEHLFCIVFALPFFAFSYKGLKQITKQSWVYLILSGVIGSAVGTVLFTLSLKLLNPSVANVLLNFQPLITVLFARILLKEKVGRGFYFWAVLAIVCGAIVATDNFDIKEFHWSLGLICIAITAMAWGFSTVAGRGAMLSMPLGTASLGRFIIGAVAILVSLILEGKFNRATMNWNGVPNFFVIKNYLWLSVVSGVIPLYFYFKGLQKTPASVGGFCEMTQTFSALLLTWGVMGNALAPKQVVAGLILIFCVYMVNLNFSRANENKAVSS
jgi:drug/metabolite transporter (DMT)-like permease